MPPDAPKCAPAPATTPRQPTLRRPPASPPCIDAALRLARDQRLPASPLGQPVPALAHGNLLGAARGQNRISRLLSLHLAAPPRSRTIPPLGRADGFMIFTKRLRDGVRRGDITCSIRIWTRPHVL